MPTRRGESIIIHRRGHGGPSSRATPGLLVALALACHAAAAAGVEDCGSVPAAPAVRQAAEAVWLDRRTVRWPGAPRDGRYRLAWSSGAALDPVPGRPLARAAGRLTLATVAADEANPARFRHVKPGADLRLPPLPVRALRELHRSPLLLLREDARGNVLAATALHIAGALDDLYASAARLDDLGVTFANGRTRFRLWAPTARAVTLCLHAARGAPADLALAMRRDEATGSWTAAVPASREGGYYRYRVEVPRPGGGLETHLVTDPYSLSLDTDSRLSYITRPDAPATLPAGWSTAPRPAAPAAAVDAVIYELHVRDFSVADDTVPAADRGRYRAFAAAGSAGMRHLAGLARAGVNEVHLLPVFDFSSVPEAGCDPAASPDKDCHNWGYDPLHFNAPEGSYASDAGDGATRMREFREMVMGLHGAGLRVGMDVVYNHTAASGTAAGSVLDRVVPGYYHRLDAQGRVERSTCCENTATEHAMMEKLMTDSVVSWARHYRIDAFRFDLMGHQPRAAMVRLKAAVEAAAGGGVARAVTLIGEGWNFGEVADGARFAQASQRSLGGAGIATFSDRARDALRGGSAGDGGAALVARQGYLNGLHYDANGAAQDTPATREDLMRAADLVRAGLAGTLADYPLTDARGTTRPLAELDYAGQPAGYAQSPGEVVNYVENHDNHTLFDINAYRLPRGTSAEDRVRAQMLGVAATAFSQGVAYFHAGIEILRSKSLDRNSYDSGDLVNRLDWRYVDNHFGAARPAAAANQGDQPFLDQALATPGIRAGAGEIALARGMFRDFLAIRASSTLFRLRHADEVRRRLTFHNTGPAQVPTVIAAHLDGRGLAGAGFEELAYFINVDKVAHTLVVPALAGRAFTLHPVHRAAAAADPRPGRDARYDPTAGTFTLPPRTALVYVAGIERTGEAGRR